MKIKKFDSINVIPFIDVLLVLLAIVLMTSTFISKGIIPVSLPKSSSSDSFKPKKEITITIKQSGEFFINKTKISKKFIETKILEVSKQSNIFISSDKSSKFEDFVLILDLLKKHNYKNISIVTKK